VLRILFFDVKMKKKVPKNTPPEGVDDTFADRFGQVLMSKGLNFFN
jgi:hypothetical protein